MKLSEIKGERVFDVIADIIEPCCNIAMDEKSAGLFKREKPEGMSPKDFALSKVKNHLPSLLGEHKNDVIAIMCAMKGIKRDEYCEGLTMASLVGDIFEMVTDEDLLSFLS